MEGVLHIEDHTRNKEVDLIMVAMLDLEARGYFGPRKNRPSTVAMMRYSRRRPSNLAQQTVGATNSKGGEE